MKIGCNECKQIFEAYYSEFYKIFCYEKQLIEFYQGWYDLGKYHCEKCFKGLQVQQKKSLNKLILECESSNEYDFRYDRLIEEGSDKSHRDYLFDLQREEQDKKTDSILSQ